MAPFNSNNHECFMKHMHSCIVEKGKERYYPGNYLSTTWCNHNAELIVTHFQQKWKVQNIDGYNEHLE